MSNLTCPAPFLPESAYPRTGGYPPGRFCGPIQQGLSCCLPCPLDQWVFSENFRRNADLAAWFNVPALLCQVFLLLSFAVLPVERSGRHYLSVGLCFALILLELAFIIPLGTKPDICFNDITPKDMHSSLSCAWTGAMLEAGSMAAVTWILLRSVWTHLRVCWDLKHTRMYMWLAHILGWGVPFFFVTLSLSVTGVSYRLGGICVPNPHAAFVTWFGWLIAIGCTAALIQFATTGFCLVVYARNLLGHNPPATTTLSTTSSAPMEGAGKPKATPSSKRVGKRLAWRRVSKVMLIQWRSIVLSLLITVETIYYGTTYVAQVEASKTAVNPKNVGKIEEWIFCLILSQGDKKRCLDLGPRKLGLDESVTSATLFLVALIGIFTFLLLVRWSMLTAWWELLRHPRTTLSAWSEGREGDDGNTNWVLIKPKAVLRPTKQISLGRKLASEAEEKPSQGVLPSPENETQVGVPEAGDVARRHETTNFFEEGTEGGTDGPVSSSRKREEGGLV